MKVERIIATIGDYTLLKLANTKFQPYVVAWQYDEKSKTWCQGHYFECLFFAYADLKYRTKTAKN